jgi:hypothetical protein
MNLRTILGLMVVVSLAAGCNSQRPTFRFVQPTTTQKAIVPDLTLTPPPLSPTPSRWEYKVMKVQQDGEQELTKFLNEQSRQGWEFVGQLQTKEHYLVLRRPRPPRDYLHGNGGLPASDLPDKFTPGKPDPNLLPDLPLRPSRGSTARSSTKRDTRPNGFPRLNEKPER